MLQQIDKKKVFVYIFFFFFLSTFNNIFLNKLSFPKINEISISGLNNENNLKIIDELDFVKMENIFLIDKKDIKNVFEKKNFIEKFYIKKQYPSTLNIVVQKTNFLANTIIDEKFFFVGSNGKLILSNTSNEKLPYLFGKPNIKEFINFLGIFEEVNLKLNDISEIYYFQSKRWDVKTKKNILIKLPDTNIKNALQLGYDIINDSNFKNINKIDLRINNQIILNDK
jgi:cell division protein FtsQ